MQRQKNVGLLVWYNSAGSWNTVKFTPKDKLLTHESRVKEFTRLKAMGIKGLKIDFFAGDGQSMINYYQDIWMMPLNSDFNEFSWSYVATRVAANLSQLHDCRSSAWL